MIRYENYLDSKSTNIKNTIKNFKNKINYELDESCSSGDMGKLFYNFDVSNGALCDGIGIGDVVFKYNSQMYRLEKKVNFPEKYQVLGCWYFPYYDTIAKQDCPAMIIYCSDRKFYFIFMHHPDTDMLEIPNLTFESVPLVVCSKINGIDNLILVSENDGMYTWNPIDGAKKVENAPIITSMCSQYDRLFVTNSVDKKAIYYSESLNPTNFNILDNEGGIITLYDDFGNCNKVISFKGFVYIFRDYNIAKITAYGDDDEFVVSQLHISSGKIFSNTICACGDKILYLASDGLYSFDGNKSTKLDVSINNLIVGNENELASGSYSNGCYYLACRMNFNDNIQEGCEKGAFINNALLKLDLSDYQFTVLRGYDIKNVVALNDSVESYVLVIYNNGESFKCGMLNNSGMYYEIPTHKVWQSVRSDFGYVQNKIIREITFDSDTPGKVKILYDNKEKVFEFGAGSQKIKPLIKCKRFSVAFHVDFSSCKISNLSIKVGVLC